MENKKETGLKTYFAVIPQMGEYVAKTIEPSELPKFDFGFEVNAKETGIQSTKFPGITEQFPRGAFDITVYRKGETGDFRINGWTFPGILNGTYLFEDKWVSFWMNFNICDPEGKTEYIPTPDSGGAKAFYFDAAIQYLKIVMEYCIYNSLKEHQTLSKIGFYYLLYPSDTNVSKVREEFSMLQLLSDVIRRLDTSEEIPEYVKTAARKRYSSIIKQIKESTNFEKLFEIMINAIPQQE